MATQPAAAFNVTADGESAAAISLSWTTPTTIGTPTYTVQFSTNSSSGPWQTAGVITNGATSFATGNLTPGATYWWQVAVSAIVGSGTSNVISEVQPSLAYLNYTLVSATSAKFTWTNNASYGGLLSFGTYVLYEQVGTGSPSVAATITNNATHTTTVSGLSSGTSYAFFLNTTDCLGGCGGGATSETESNFVTVGTPLPLGASISVNRPTVDVGQLDFFICTPAGGRSPFTFSWNFASGANVSGNGSISHGFAAPGNPIITCVVTDAGLTKASAALAITVAADPVLAISVNRSAADAGQTIGFICNASRGVAPVSLQWTLGDGNVVPGGVASHAYTAQGRFFATCSGTDATSTQVANATAITVSPRLSVTLTASSSAAAPQTSLTFTAQPANGSGVYGPYQWTFGDGATGSTTVVSHAYASAGNYTVTLKTFDGNGAASTTTVAVSVSPVRVQLGTVPSSITSGTSLTLTANASGGAGGPYNFTWTLGDGATAYGARVVHRYAASGSFHPSVKVRDRLGASATAALMTLAVTPPPPPSTFFTAPVLLGLALLIVAIAIAGFFVLRRQAARRQYQALAGRVPLGAPGQTLHGTKICPSCGTVNLPIRKTCEACGASLRLA